MGKFEVRMDEGKIEKLRYSGTIAEIVANLILFTSHLRGTLSDDDRYLFDIFIKDVFADLVLAGDDKGKMARILKADLPKKGIDVKDGDFE